MWPGRIAATLGIRLPACRILYVRPDPPGVVSANAWLVLPLHVVISSQGNRTDLCILDVLPHAGGFLNPVERELIHRTQRDVIPLAREHFRPDELHVTFRLLGGFALLGAGLVLAIPGIPGPGIVLIAGGLWLLSERFAWAPSFA